MSNKDAYKRLLTQTLYINDDYLTDDDYLIIIQILQNIGMYRCCERFNEKLQLLDIEDAIRLNAEKLTFMFYNPYGIDSK